MLDDRTTLHVYSILIVEWYKDACYMHLIVQFSTWTDGYLLVDLKRKSIYNSEKMQRCKNIKILSILIHNSRFRVAFICREDTQITESLVTPG